MGGWRTGSRPGAVTLGQAAGEVVWEERGAPPLLTDRGGVETKYTTRYSALPALHTTFLHPYLELQGVGDQALPLFLSYSSWGVVFIQVAKPPGLNSSLWEGERRKEKTLTLKPGSQTPLFSSQPVGQNLVPRHPSLRNRGEAALYPSSPVSH